MPTPLGCAAWSAALFAVSASSAFAQPPILTLEPGPAPRINGPKIYGARPARPFLYRIPCTGERPIRFWARDLPASLQLDPASGMADYGYQYVNIDDCWMVRPDSSDPMLGGAPRDASGVIRSNRNFPDMKALADYIHSKGLKAGPYTSPGPLTCAKYTGSYQHEELDARAFAAWGFDFLKYDWCSYGRVVKAESVEDRQRPYRLMGDILKKLDRDIVFNLCQYGAGEVWKWGGEVGSHCWRTTGDLGLEKDTRLPGFYSIGFKNARHYEYAGPGRWNDPDYILIGYLGNARRMDEPPRPTTLTPDEQYSYLSMWALMAAPLFFSGDMARLDRFTLNVLCNSEVIDVDQDPLGKQARSVTTEAERPLLEVLREDLGLTGVKYGCGEGQCRACAVLIDGRPVISCITQVRMAEGKSIVTIEGLAQSGKLHPVQQVFQRGLRRYRAARARPAGAGRGRVNGESSVCPRFSAREAAPCALLLSLT